MMLKRAVRNYQSGFGFTMPPAPTSFALLAQGGIRPAQSFQRPITLGDIEGGALDTLTSAGKSLVKGVTEKTDRLENALTIITVLSGIAAITGIAGLVRR